MLEAGRRVPVAVVGSGNIGTDLVKKLLRSSILEPAVLVGIDPDSDGLAKARRWGVEATHEGVDWLLAHAAELGVRLVYEATSARIHAANAPRFRDAGLVAIDLTPAAVGPAVVPPVNLRAHLDAPNLNMITCGGQATIPVVAAVRRVTPVPYAEIVSTVASRSAGPGTRANIDEFTETTSRAIIKLGGAAQGKALIILNPAEPPLIMRDTVYCLAEEGADEDAIRKSIDETVAKVAAYVPGYRLKQRVQFEKVPADRPLNIPGIGQRHGLKVTVFLEVEGAGHYLPAYAGNLDIMTSAAMAAADALAESKFAIAA